MSPNRMPVAIDSAIVNARTRQSTVTTEPFSPTRGRPAVFTASSARIPAVPRSRPSAPPTNDSMRLSVSSCRMMRPRPAPMAARTAISRLRVVARASSRFATFAHAMSSTKLTAPSSSQSVGRTFATSASRSGSALKNVSRPSALGNLRVYSAAETFSRACACSSVTSALEPPRGLEVMALVARLRVQLERQPHIRSGSEVGYVERGADDSDHDVRVAADRDRLVRRCAGPIRNASSTGRGSARPRGRLRDGLRQP